MVFINFLLYFKHCKQVNAGLLLFTFYGQWLI